MKLRIPAFICLALAGSLISREAYSQVGRNNGSNIPIRKPTNDSMKIVKILNANTYHSEQKDSTETQYWSGNVRFLQGNTLIDCDSMIMYPQLNYIESFGHVHINDNDSTNIYADYMKYLVDVRTIHFLKNVKLTDGKGILTTEDMQYDLNQKVGVYDHGGKIVNNGSVLTSEHATYFEDSKDVHFSKDVVLKDPQYDLSADSLLYNTQTQVSTFITETLILFKDTTHRSVRTSSGYYDLKNRKAEFGKRPIINDGASRIIGDSVQIDDSTGISIARGNAVFRDTAQGVVLHGGILINDQKKREFLATRNPVMVLKQEKDSIYITADTLYSGRLVDAIAMAKKLALLDSLHKVYVDSLQQASADSLHNVALSKRAPQDTLLPVITDSSSGQVISDRSDSVGRGRRDSLARLAFVKDSMATVMVSVDSAKAVAAAADSLKRSEFAADSLQQALTAKSKKHSRRERDQQLQKPAPAGIRPPTARKPPDLAAKPPEEIKLPDSAVAQAPPVKVEQDRDREKFTDTATAPFTDTTIRYILGFHHVRIFSDSLQAVADSMYYSGRDSIFRLFKDPIAWGNGNYQITGDTMYVYTKNKKANRLYVFENGLAINRVGLNFYNQIKGTTINAYFKNGEVDYMRAKGNAESIYYVKDDSNAYTGVNKAHADIIDMIFAVKDSGQGRELRRVVLRNDAEGSMIPFKKVNFEEMRLRGFKWQEARRPKRKEDLFESPEPISLQEPKRPPSL